MASLIRLSRCYCDYDVPGLLAVQQRARDVATLPHRLPTGRHPHPTHPRGFRRRRRPLLGPRRERRRQGDLLGPTGRRRRVTDPSSGRVTAGDPAQARRPRRFRAATSGPGQAARPARPTTVAFPRGDPPPREEAGLPAGGCDDRATRAARVRRAVEGHRRPGGNPGHLRGVRSRSAGADNPVVPRGKAADGRSRLRDIVPRRAREAVDTGSVPGGRWAVLV